MIDKARQNQAPHRPVNNGTQTPSTQSVQPQPQQMLNSALKAVGILPALERMCSAKMAAEFTRHQSETWCAALGVFPVGVANRALLEIAMSDDPFPNLGKVIMRCQAEMAKRSTVVSQVDTSKPMRSTINAVAKAFEIKLED
jgi:hypothetical protein